MSPQPTSQQLSELLVLLRQARRAASVEELRFLLSNSTHSLLPYRQAALVEQGRVTCLSGTVSVERNAPYVEWLERLSDCLSQAGDITRIDASQLPAKLGAAWADWLPAFGVWVPVGQGGLLLARDLPWSDAELVLLNEWATAWLHALRALRDSAAGHIGWRRWLGIDPDSNRAGPRSWWLRKRWWAIVVLLAVVSIPVPMTVLAPAELVPRHPELVRAPLDAVIDRVHVQPNQMVRKGDLLLSFDERVLAGRIDVARQALNSAEAEYQQTTQRALSDVQVKSQLAMLAGRVEERRAELALAESQLTRTRVVAQRDGVALIDDPSAWSGKPVALGERIFRIADPADVEVEAWLGVHDLTGFREHSVLRVYLNSDPLHPVTARLRYVSYEASERPDGSFAYRMRAALEPGQVLPRVGAKGTARIESREVSLGYWLLRKPWAAARAWLGW